jgi:hypothetical protein
MKNKIPVQVYVTPELDEFLKERAKQEGNTRAGIVRRWLLLIQAGKIKVEGIG